MSYFKVTDLTVGYGGKMIVNDVSFAVERGELTGILGANGSGKTTFLKAICNILPHEGMCEMHKAQGMTKLESLSAKELARLCSYIPQRSGISIDISVLDVVLMGCNPKLGILERPNKEMRERASEILKIVGLPGKEEMNYQFLSEGQKQLCILARTLMQDAKLLLLDEPESSLDLRYRYHMLEILRKSLKEGESSAVVALHDPALALNYCDRLLLFSEGRIVGEMIPAKDSPEEMERKLMQIYGPVSLHRYEDRAGHMQLVMIKEPEEL